MLGDVFLKQGFRIITFNLLRTTVSPGLMSCHSLLLSDPVPGHSFDISTLKVFSASTVFSKMNTLQRINNRGSWRLADMVELMDINHYVDAE